MAQANAHLEELWRSLGNQGDLPAGWWGPGGTSDGGGLPSPFSFDYEGEAKKSYGELGPYYDRILKESQGDLNKALARLTQDYDTGKRIRTEDTAEAVTDATRINRDNALQRGIYRKSLYDPKAGMGIADRQLQERTGDINRASARSGEAADLTHARSREDLPEQQRRNEFQLEQERREKAANLTDQRAGRAYQSYQTKLYNPTLT